MAETSINKSTLKWQCRRGMLELDLLLEAFLDEQYEQFTKEQQRAFYDLLQIDDPFIQAWVFCDVAAPQELESIVHDIITWRKTTSRT